MSQIDRTPEAIQKEHRIQQLESAIKKKRTTIKSLRTRLEKTKDAIQDMVRKSSSMMSSAMERTIALQKELTQLLTELLREKKILQKKAHKEAVQEILESFQAPEEEEFQKKTKKKEKAQEKWEDTEDRPPQNPFTEFQQAPDKEEKRNIRKLYLKLSQLFHPDMATNEEENERNHEMMKRITQAYENHDVHTLLEMERVHAEENYEELADPNATNLLDARIERLQREFSFLENQATRLKVELRHIRKSDPGKALKDFTHNERHGFGLDEQRKEMDAAMAPLEELKSIIEEALAKNKMTDRLEAELTPAPEDSLDGMLAMLDHLLEGEEDNFGRAWAEKADHQPSKFEEGDMVVLRHNQLKKSTGLKKGMAGYITKVFFSGGPPIYQLIMEESAMRELKPEIIDFFLDEFCEYPLLEVEESDIQVKEKVFIDQDASLAVGRRRMYEQLVKRPNIPLSTSQKKRLLAIVLREPAQTDYVNWMRISDFQRLPSKAKVSIADNDFPQLKGIETAIFLQIQEFEEARGFQALIQIQQGGSTVPVPLHLVRFSHIPAALQEILDIYQVWGKLRLPPFSGGSTFFFNS